MKECVVKNNYRKYKGVENDFEVPKELCSNYETYKYSKINEKISNETYKDSKSPYINENNDINKVEYAHDNYCQYEPNYEEIYGGYDETKEENDKYKKDLGTIYNYNNITENNVYHEIKSPEKKSYNKYIYNTDYKRNKKTTNILYKNNYYNTNYYNKNKNYKNEYYSSFKLRNGENIEKNEYNYKNKTQKTYNKYETYTEGRIENYYEDNISKDGQYLVTISISKIVNEPVPKTYNNLYENNTYKGYNTYIDKVEDINYIRDYKCSNEKIKEIKKNECQEDKKEKEKNNKNKTNNNKFGHNYIFNEKKEKVCSSKSSQTYQRMKKPIHKTQMNVYNKELPEKEVKTVIKSYKKEVKGNNDNKNNMRNYDNLKMIYINATTTKNKTKQINRNYS